MNNDFFGPFFSSLFSLQIWGIVKGLIAFFLLLYFLFAVVVIRQVNLMKKALNGILELPLVLLAWFHLGFAIIVFLLALASL